MQRLLGGGLAVGLVTAAGAFVLTAVPGAAQEDLLKAEISTWDAHPGELITVTSVDPCVTFDGTTPGDIVMWSLVMANSVDVSIIKSVAEVDAEGHWDLSFGAPQDPVPAHYLFKAVCALPESTGPVPDRGDGTVEVRSYATLEFLVTNTEPAEGGPGTDMTTIVPRPSTGGATTPLVVIPDPAPATPVRVQPDFTG
jgi:hypothetical protein